MANDWLVSALLPEIRYEVEDSTTPYNYADAEIRSYINEAVAVLWRELAERAPWYFDSTASLGKQTIAIVIAQQTYTLPSDFYKARVLLVNGAETDNLKLKDFGNENADGYLLHQGQLWLLPAPTATGSMDLYYIKEPTRVTVNTSSIPLSGMFWEVIKNMAVMKCKIRNAEDGGGTQLAYGVARAAVSAYAMSRNAPADRGSKAAWYNYR